MADLERDPTFIPAVTTYLSLQEIAVHLSHAWKKLMGMEIKDEQLGIVWTQVCLETASGTKMMNNNFGNIKKKPGNFFTSYKCHEYDNQGIKHEYLPPDKQTWFSAWKSPDEGAMGYLLYLQQKYPEGFQAIKNGDISTYVKAIKKRGYFTAPEDKYLARMKQELFIFERDVKPKLIREEPEPLTVKEPSIERKSEPTSPPRDPSLPSPITGRPQEFTLPEVGGQTLGFWTKVLNFFRRLF